MSARKTFAIDVASKATSPLVAHLTGCPTSSGATSQSWQAPRRGGARTKVPFFCSFALSSARLPFLLLLHLLSDYVTLLSEEALTVVTQAGDFGGGQLFHPHESADELVNLPPRNACPYGFHKPP